MSEQQGVREALIATKRYLEEHGWCQRVEFGPDGSACLLGALCVVAKDIYDRSPAYEALCDHPYVRKFGAVSYFNDSQKTRLVDVYKVLDDLIGERS